MVVTGRRQTLAWAAVMRQSQAAQLKWEAVSLTAELLLVSFLLRGISTLTPASPHHDILEMRQVSDI